MASERCCDLSNSKSQTMVKEKRARLQKYRIKHVNTKLKKKSLFGHPLFTLILN